MSEQPNPEPAATPKEPGVEVQVDLLSSNFAKNVKEAMGEAPPAPAEGAPPPVVPAAPALPAATPAAPDPAKPPDPAAADDRENNLAALRAAREKSESDLRTAKLEAEELKVKLSGFDPQEIAALKEAQGKNEETIKRLSVEGDPRFRAEYDEKRQQAIEDGTAAAGENAEMVEAVLRMEEGKAKQKFLNQLLEEVDENVRDDVKGAARDIRRLNTERTRHLKDWRKTHDDMVKADETLAREDEQKRTAAAQLQYKESLGLFERVAKAATDPEKGLPPFVAREGDQAHAEQVTKMTEAARNSLFGRDVTQVDSMISAFKGAAADVLMNENALLIAKVNAQDAQIKELTAASPSPSAQPPADGPGPTGFLESVRTQMGGQIDPQ